MNLLKSIICAVAAASLSAQAFAQAELPIRSPDEFRAYAIRRARESMGWMSGSGVVSQPDSGRRWSDRKSSVDLLAEAKLSLKVETVAPDSPVTSRISILDEKGNLLFDGYTEKRPELVDGKWTMPKSAGDIELQSAWALWIELEKPVSQAFLIVREQGGGESWYELATSGNQILFARDSLGLKDAYVRAIFSDGTTTSWSSSTGKRIQTTTLAVVANPTLAQVASYFDPSLVSIEIKADRGQGKNVTIEIRNTAARDVAFNVSTSEGRRPIRFRYLPPGTDDWNAVEVSKAAVFPVTIRIPAGDVYVVPEWNPEDLAPQAYPVQTGGGKG